MDGWEVLDFDEDPTPGDPDGVASLAAGLLNDADAADQRTSQLRTVADTSDDLHMQGDYAPRFQEILAGLPASHAALATSYRSCGESLTTYAQNLADAQAESAAALDQGSQADSDYQGQLEEFCDLVPLMLPQNAVWRGLNADTAQSLAMQHYGEDINADILDSATDIGANAALCEADRQAAKSRALNAADDLSQAQAQCAQQVGEALPAVPGDGPSGDAGGAAQANAGGAAPAEAATDPAPAPGTPDSGPASTDAPGGYPLARDPGADGADDDPWSELYNAASQLPGLVNGQIGNLPSHRHSRHHRESR